MIIRQESVADIKTISDVTKAAFKDHQISKQTEHFIINALRANKALTISLVAEIEGKIVGHIAFSPVNISDDSQGWYGLGPVSVLPEYQRQGVGKTLIYEGLERLKAKDAQGCILVGDPAYYRQFGFKSFPELTHDGVPQKNVLVLSFIGQVPKGVVTFHKSFTATE